MAVNPQPENRAMAPIALFAYRRPDHLEQVLGALRLNAEAAASDLYVFCDGAKDRAARAGVARVRQLVADIQGFKSVRVVERAENFGLAKNLTQGISEVLSRHETIVVVEDDIVVSRRFLEFMNEALALYRGEARVGSISGYAYPVTQPVPETYFILGADCWGWATWRDQWSAYNPDGAALLSELNRRGLAHAFNFDGTMDYMQMLADQTAGRNDSWAVRWHASCYLRDLLMLYPGRSLVQNIGNDSSGTHARSTDSTYEVEVSDRPVSVSGIPIEENAVARRAIVTFFNSRVQGEFTDRFFVLRAIKLLLARLGLWEQFRAFALKLRP